MNGQAALVGQLQQAVAAADAAARSVAAHSQNLRRRGRAPARWETVPGVAERLFQAWEPVVALLEMLVAKYDDVLPAPGPSYHATLIRRAAKPLDSRRPAILSPATAALLLRLNDFRQGMRTEAGTRSYPQAAAVAHLAPRAVRGVIADVVGFIG